jgi:hypothetical protein
MIQYYDPKYTGNQWYLPTKSSKLYSPMCKAVIDMKNDINFRRKVAIRKYPSLRPKEIELFLRSSAPEYS